VVVHSFDPGGGLTVLDEPGVYIDSQFETDDYRKPQAYKAWSNELSKMRKEGAFEDIGTLYIDSLTNLFNCMIWQIVYKEGRTPPGMDTKTDATKHGMRMQDWNTVLTTAQMITRTMNNLPCHVVFTGHIIKDKDEVTGGQIIDLSLPGKSRTILPLNLSEYYVLRKDPKGERYLLTDTEGLYNASSRISKGRLKQREEPDIKNILQTCDLDYQDKPF
jgi:hypothetical protein